MKINFAFLLTVLCLAVIPVYLLSKTQYVEDSKIASVCSPAIKKAILKMGPRKTYRLIPTLTKDGKEGRLEVKINGEWLKLRY